MNPIAIIKVTEKCNMYCGYCIESSVSKGNIMTLDIIDLSMRRLIDFSDSTLTTIFHGGEPLLAGKKFFEYAIKSQEENNKGIEINNRIQTNGLLLNKDIINFFKKNNIKISLSYDGPKDIHDLNRILVNGQGTHKKIIEKIKLLKDNGINDYGIVTLLTKKSKGNEKRIYNSLKQISKRARLNLFIPDGRGKSKSDQLYLTNEEASNMLLKFYKLWANDSETFNLRPFSEIVKSMINGKGSTCEYSCDICSSVFSIGPTGDVYTCGRLMGNKEFFMGNLKRYGLEDMLESDIHKKRLNRKKLIIEQCGDCEYINICEGGCGAESLALENNFHNRTHYCKTKIKLYSYIKEHLKSFTKNATN